MLICQNFSYVVEVKSYFYDEQQLVEYLESNCDTLKAVFTDSELPHMQGIEIVKVVREWGAGKKVGVYMTSGNENLEF